MIRYATGDATQPEGDGPHVIVHVCNDERAWSAGFVLAVSRRWPEPENVYRSAPDTRLGDVQICDVGGGLYVANMIAQHGFPSRDRRCALDYDALRVCLEIVGGFAKKIGASVAMPRIGCGIAGGEWSRVVEVIGGTLGVLGVDVTVYDLPLNPRAA